jgi:hypothetical protein
LIDRRPRGVGNDHADAAGRRDRSRSGSCRGPFSRCANPPFRRRR